ncbi:MAG TPA: hypothetical protein DCG48_08395 [Rhodospirillaceae bacterium]|nr:hypothetical protein [Rhodospirillaceae bacterium]|tara:strand:+ start:6905 stop:7564 length:660 start_codon:yes stop_codon:yes gene_type:complete
MSIGLGRRPVRVVGHTINMTVSDFAAFWEALFEKVPHARLFIPQDLSDGVYPEISLSEAIAKFQEPYGVSFVVVFEGDDWRPVFVPAPDYPDTLRLTLTNKPTLLMSYHSGRPQKIEKPFLKDPIYVHRPGGLHGSHFADDAEGKRIIDTAFRIFRKMFDNQFRVVDLRSGAHVQDETFDEWYGPGMATFCLSNPGNFLRVLLDDRRENYWGYLPAAKS